MRIPPILFLLAALAGCAQFDAVAGDTHASISPETVARARQWQKRQFMREALARSAAKREQPKTEGGKAASQGNDAKERKKPGDGAIAAKASEAPPSVSSGKPTGAALARAVAPAKAASPAAEGRISMDAALAKAEEALKREEELARTAARTSK